MTEAVKELRRAVTELKLVGLMLPAVGLRLPLGHESFWPIYAEAEKLGCMVGVPRHSARAALFCRRYVRPVYRSAHAVAFVRANVAGVQHDVSRRVRSFPESARGFYGSGLQLGAVLVRAHERGVGKRGEVEAPMCKRKPTEYLKDGRIYFHAEDYEPMIGATTGDVDAQGHLLRFRLSRTGTRSFRKISSISADAKI